MGDKHIYDIIGLHLPDHLKSSINTVKFMARRTNCELIVDALEQCFKDLGLKPGANDTLPDKRQLLEKEGLYCQFRKVRL
ncbi:MAG: hypothetical protein M1130_03085 [Actinobacteria bacterium]|nr:hypothetical protein [Actinomycetota bacterium]